MDYTNSARNSEITDLSLEEFSALSLEEQAKELRNMTQKAIAIKGNPPPELARLLRNIDVIEMGEPMQVKRNADTYLQEFLDPKVRRNTVNRCVRAIRKEQYDRDGVFDAVVVTGTSGLLIGPQVAENLNLPLVIVRKAHGDRIHNPSNDVEAKSLDLASYVIIDDFVDQGSTVMHAIEEVNNAAGNIITDVCLCLYNTRDKRMGRNIFIDQAYVDNLFHNDRGVKIKLLKP